MPENAVLALVPVYNADVGVLNRTVQSLLDQSVSLDILIIDDGSKDPVAPDLAGLQRTTVLRLTHNLGITAALRAGVEYGHEHGYEYFCRLDVGDVCRGDRVELQLREMRARPELDLLGCYSRVLDLEGRLLFLHGNSKGPAAIREYLWQNSPFKHSTFFIRAASMARLGNYCPSFPVAQDYERLLCFSRSGVVDCLLEPLVDYVDDPAGISGRRRNMQLRMRLKAQIKYADVLTPAWYIGVLRTMMLMVIPNRIAKILSLLHWRASGFRS